MFGPKGPFCQSCGMPLSKDEKGGGTEKDGSISGDYCSKCYQNGQFTEPEITLQEMQDKVLAKMKEMGFPGFIGKFFIKSMPELKRWQNAN